MANKRQRIYCTYFYTIVGIVVLSFFAPEAKAKSQSCDSSAIEQAQIPSLRLPKEQKLNTLRKQETYQYGQDVVIVLTPWQRFKAWLNDKIGRFIFRNYDKPYWKWLTYTFIVMMALFALLKILGVDISFIFKRKGKEPPLSYNNISENIHEIDFSALIQEAIEVQNYRLAIRLLYLKTLKQLSDTGLINWQLTKTNRTYLYEIKNIEKREYFEKLTHQFEYVWYGDFSPSQEQFDKIHHSFKGFQIK